jgi:predicted PilT family ATPase
VQYVRNALSPAKVSRVSVNEAEKTMQVVVPDDQLSLAIGKRGQNVRLAAKLTHWKIDIKSESEAETDSERKEALRRAEQAFVPKRLVTEVPATAVSAPSATIEEDQAATESIVTDVPVAQTDDVSILEGSPS